MERIISAHRLTWKQARTDQPQETSKTLNIRSLQYQRNPPPTSVEGASTGAELKWGLTATSDAVARYRGTWSLWFRRQASSSYLFLKHTHHQPNEICMRVYRTRTKAKNLFLINLTLSKRIRGCLKGKNSGKCHLISSKQHKYQQNIFSMCPKVISDKTLERIFNESKWIVFSIIWRTADIILF